MNICFVLQSGIRDDVCTRISMLLKGVHPFVHFNSWLLVVGYLHIPIF